MRATITELPDEPTALEAALGALRRHVRDAGSDVVLLPEMIGSPWFCRGPDPDLAVWEDAVARHDALVARLGDLGAPAVLGTRPRTLGERRVNEAFAWTPAGGAVAVHEKRYLPDEPGWHEARWYHRGERSFGLAGVGDLEVGFLVCTDVMFPEHARDQGRRGAHLIAVPRASQDAPRWEVACRMAAVVSGAYVLSSNRSPGPEDGGAWGGGGFAVDPEGTLLATTTLEAPFATVDLDPEVAERAKATYPRYVEG